MHGSRLLLQLVVDIRVGSAEALSHELLHNLADGLAQDVTAWCESQGAGSSCSDRLEAIWASFQPPHVPKAVRKELRRSMGDAAANVRASSYLPTMPALCAASTPSTSCVSVCFM